MKNHFDLVIIGGGPAGSAAGYTAATLVMAVCIIDKQKFPRDKLCGGLVTSRAKKNFEATFNTRWNDKMFVSSEEVSFFQHGRALRDKEELGPDIGPPLYFTMRKDFDQYLLSIAKDAGVKLLTSHKIKEIDFENGCIGIENEKNITFDFLIGADGVNSAVAKSIFDESFNQKTIGFGLEVEVPKNDLPNQSDNPEVDFGSAVWGYGWVFPKKQSYTVGVGGIHSYNPDLKSRLAAYLKQKNLDIESYKVKGHFIPFGDFRKNPGRKNVLLCGDAAGFVDPITGEGIGHAILSGQQAAKAIFEAISENKTDATDQYFQLVQPITNSLKQANILRWLIFPKYIQAPFAWAFSDARTLRAGYLQVLAGNKEYNYLYGVFFKQVKKALSKPFRKLLG